MNLATRYLGLELAHPLVPSPSPLSSTLDGVKRLEDAGAPAIVLFSLFEEQLTLHPEQLHRLMGEGVGGYGHALALLAEQPAKPGPLAYLEHLRRAKEATRIPMIASLNGRPDGHWVPYAKLLQQAGADALEINFYHLPSNPLLTATETEASYLRTIRELRRALHIPLAVKIHPYFSSLPNIAQQMHNAGADALVLFNRFYQPDLDIETLRLKPTLRLSHSEDLRLPLRWIAILYNQTQAQLAATGGIHRPEDALKALYAGATITMVCSALLEHGPQYLRTLQQELAQLLDQKGGSLEAIRGTRSLQNAPDPSAYERAQYMLTLNSWSA